CGRSGQPTCGLPPGIGHTRILRRLASGPDPNRAVCPRGCSRRWV
ncbi:MAG: hypothetical protein AVDCRST_MAG73-1665, partial [uncultured Thermomicrobiales bacterium]